LLALQDEYDLIALLADPDGKSYSGNGWPVGKDVRKTSAQVSKVRMAALNVPLEFIFGAT
jgi:hypothetical protein